MHFFRQNARCTCVVCERPAQPHALVCDYCGEDLPQRRRLLCQRAGMAAAALFTPAAFAAMHGWPRIPGKLTLPGGLLLALGIGLALLPPKLRGVAGATRRERLGQVVPRYFGGLALALLTAIATLAAGTSNPWSMTDIVVAMATTLILFIAPLALGLPWHKFVAGLLAAVGLLLS